MGLGLNQRFVTNTAQDLSKELSQGITSKELPT
jgi:hypothetical protein